MECQYCGALNAADEHRCTHCGRRLGGEPSSPSRSSPALAREPGPVIALERPDAPPPRIPQQQSLFRVIPFEAIAPPKPVDKGAVARPLPRGPVGRSPDPNQTFLPFEDAGVTAPSKPARVCNGTVAAAGSRSEAACFDLVMVMLGGVLFFSLSRWATGEMAWSRATLGFNVAALAAILILYRLLACLLSDRSPGMRVAGLRLLRFDGGAPSRSRRLLRDASALLSLLPAGVGLYWAFLDEEGLTFHDHISETCPSPLQDPR